MTDPRTGMDLICPMHAVLCDDGVICHAGPTLRKLRPDRDWIGEAFLGVFDVNRPRGIDTVPRLLGATGRKLVVQFRDAPYTSFRAISVGNPIGEGILVNLSFGISILEAVQDYALSGTDFAATDLTIEMLYLVEAKSAAMDASRRLNERLQTAKVTAEQQAVTDALTGLANRRGLERFVGQLIARGGDFALMHVDLDHFKQVNDTLGHDAGDYVLERVSTIMREETRDRDMVARVGGDEFVLIIDGGPTARAVERIARRLIARLSEPIVIDGAECRVSCSIGTVFSRDYADQQMARLFKDADIALYASKNAGRGRHSRFDISGSKSITR